MPLSFFRRKKSPVDLALPTRATERPDVEQPTVDAPAAPAGTDGQSSTTAPTKRRRGTRGGRNRKKSTAAGGGATAAAAPSVEPPAERRKPQERKPREQRSQGQSRRRTPPKRAPLPKAKRELVISVDAGEKRVAVLEDDKVAEVYL